MQIQMTLMTLTLLATTVFGEQAKLELVLKATGTFGPVKFSAAAN